jgi:hypothetical protein
MPPVHQAIRPVSAWASSTRLMTISSALRNRRWLVSVQYHQDCCADYFVECLIVIHGK